MDEQISKAQIVQRVQEAWAALEDVLERVPAEKMTRPGVEGNWSVKDILAHIADWERRMVGWTEASLRGETPDRPAPGMPWDDLDSLNERIYQAHKERPLAEVWHEARESYRLLLATVMALSEEALTDPGRFAWRQGQPLWPMVAANSYWHYDEHRQAIEEWLASPAGQ